jgi:Ca-activated chloride channel family protein
MNGYPLTEVAKPMMNKMISNLRPNEYMNVLLFAGGSAVLSEGQSLKATEQNKRTAISWINEQRGGGGTQILPALKRALALPRKEGLSRIIVVVTDGYVNVEPEVVRSDPSQSRPGQFVHLWRGFQRKPAPD